MCSAFLPNFGSYTEGGILSDQKIGYKIFEVRVKFGLAIFSRIKK